MPRPTSDSALRRANREQLVRLSRLRVSYMEVAPRAGAYACGKCHYAGSDPTGAPFCTNGAIDAPVSSAHGCCNLYLPRKGKPVFDAAAVRRKLRR